MGGPNSVAQPQLPKANRCGGRDEKGDRESFHDCPLLRYETGVHKVPVSLDQTLFREHNRLQTRYFKALTAAHVLASHHVVFADHVGAGLGETSAVAFVRTASQLSFFCAHQPRHFIFGRLMAMGTIECGQLLFRPFVEKVAFFHGDSWCRCLMWSMGEYLKKTVFAIIAHLRNIEKERERI
jgi:hypothetical protein